MNYRPRGSSFIRTNCLIENCSNLQSYVGKYLNGEKMYRILCDKHHKKRFNINTSDTDFFVLKKIDNSKCSICGWNKGPCDRDRIIPELGYTEGNVQILCPNCHRLKTFNLPPFNKKEDP